MPVVPYFGTYARFSTTEKAQDALLLSADCIVGNTLELKFDQGEKDMDVWLYNRFGGCMGKLDPVYAGQAQLCQAKGWKLRAILASVMCTNVENTAKYWGEVVLLAYSVANAASFDIFAEGIAHLLENGARPVVDLQQSSLAKIKETNGTWLPKGRLEPLKSGQSVVVKDHASFKEGLIEQARNRNPGCMAVGWIYITALVILAIYLLGKLIGL